MLTFVIPTYNPKIREFEKALNSALKVNFAEIIIVDDSSDEYFINYLNQIKNPRVLIEYSEKNVGAFMNSTNSLLKAKTKFVKKLDPDDNVVWKNYKAEYFQEDFDLIFTKYKFKGIFNKNSKNNIKPFNGSVIYKTDKLIDLIQVEKNHPKKYFDDTLMIEKMLSKTTNENIKWINKYMYNYKRIGSTKPKDISRNREDWMKGSKIIKSDFAKMNLNSQNLRNKILKRIYVDTLIMEDLLIVNKSFNVEIKRSNIYFKLPAFFRKWISILLGIKK